MTLRGGTVEREPAEKTTLVSWLSRALPFGDTHHNNIVKLMMASSQKMNFSRA